MPEPVATPAASVPRDAKTTAGNIVKGITDRANGHSPGGHSPNGKPPQNGKTLETPKVETTDPNAGKEKYVVDGKDVYLSPEQARAYVQKGIAFEPRIDQLARLQQETGAFLQKLATDPMAILTDKRIGLTPEIVLEKIFSSGKISDQIKEKVGQWYYKKVVSPLKMTPEELKAQENEEWREQREQQDKISQEDSIKQQNQMRVDLAMSQIKSQISEALKESGLPNNDSALGVFLAKRIADIMRLGYFQRKMVTPKEAIEKVKSDFKTLQSSWYDNLDEESLVKELGEKNAEKVKKYYLKIVKDADKKIPDQKGSVSRNGDRKTKNMDDFHDYLDSLKRNSK